MNKALAVSVVKEFVHEDVSTDDSCIGKLWRVQHGSFVIVMSQTSV